MGDRDAGKGDLYRPVNQKNYDDGHERTFGKKPERPRWNPPPLVPINTPTPQVSASGIQPNFVNANARVYSPATIRQMIEQGHAKLSLNERDNMLYVSLDDNELGKAWNRGEG